VSPTQQIVLYGIRRKDLTNLMASIGADASRKIAGHKAGSRTLERHYDVPLTVVDLTACVLPGEKRRAADTYASVR
jgi:hypothetical protein